MGTPTTQALAEAKQPFTETMQTSLIILRDYIATQAQSEPEANVQIYTQKQLHKLHGAIKIHAPQPEQALRLFITEYIDGVPDYIEALHCLANEAGISLYVQPLLALNCSYFLTPPSIIDQYQGLQRLLYSAYLSHRLIEEMNDQIMSACGAPLAKIDMNMANIVCHSLFGDELANQLDHLVLLTIETSTEGKEILEQSDIQQFMQQRSLQGWGNVLQQWPCFAKDYTIQLQLAGYC